MVSKDFDYSADDHPLAGPNEDFLGPSDYDSNGGHDGVTLGLHNPNDPFVYDGANAADNNEIRVWSNITKCKFISKSNGRPIALTMTIPSVHDNDNIQCDNNDNTKFVDNDNTHDADNGRN